GRWRCRFRGCFARRLRGRCRLRAGVSFGRAPAGDLLASGAMNATRIFGLTALALVLGACGAPQARDSVADEAQPRDETLAEPRDNRARAAAHEGEHAGGEVEAPPGQRLRVDASNAPARGARDPLVTIVMFSDFQCPFCSRVEPTLD